jgi:outer membrane receptor protein involved in Fe transport
MATLAERFGDRGAVIGNPDLAPEKGTAGDAGVAWRKGPVRLVAVAFGAWSEDLIVLLPNSQLTFRAENVGAARVLGAEARAALDLGERLRVSLGFTRLWPESRATTEDREGNEVPARDHGMILPGRSLREADGRVETGGWRAGPVLAGAFGGAHYRSQSALDRFERQWTPARTLVNAGLRASPAALPGLRVTVEARNLLDARTGTVHQDVAVNPDRTEALQDHLGYPLPGRSLYASARYLF